jgi:ring-1,2-phenylacetyl-CoA epoxidase subunit PaaE
METETTSPQFVSIGTVRADERALLATERFAWPTFILAVLTFTAWVATMFAHARGALPLGIAIPVQVALTFVAFTPLHDASHRAVARNPFINEAVGWASALPLMSPFAAFRYVHLEHHKHTNDEARDPDMWSGSGRGLSRLFRWATQDLHYYVWYAARRASRPRAEVRSTLIGVALVVALVSGLVAMGMAKEVLLLWMLPARIAIVLLALAFDYLPHRPHQVLASVAPLEATTILEHTFLTPFLLSQNYHLIHHLYPGVPFYRYGKVWWTLRDRLLDDGAVVRKLWGKPALRSGSQSSRAAASNVTTSAPRAPSTLEVLVSRIDVETDDARSFVLDIPEEHAGTFRYRAGQFLTFELELDGEVVRRSYSFSSAPEAGEAPRVTVKRVPGGRVSNHMHDHVKVGAKLRVRGPEGRFVLRDGRAGGPIVLIAAGSGITPVLSLAKSALLASQGRSVTLLYANRTARAVILRQEIDALADRFHDRFRVVHHLDDERGMLSADAMRGWLVDAVEPGVLGRADVYVCGPSPFMDLAEAALDALGVPDAQRFRERFSAARDGAPDATAKGPASPETKSTGTPQSLAAQRANDRYALRVLLDGEAHELDCRADETLLAAAQRQGLVLPSSCEEGYCGSCIARLVEGDVTMDEHSALSNADVRRGLILPCQARPKAALGNAPSGAPSATPSIAIAYDEP